MSEIYGEISAAGVVFGTLIAQTGAKGDTGAPGKDYVLTESDIEEIASKINNDVQTQLNAISNKNIAQDTNIQKNTEELEQAQKDIQNNTDNITEINEKDLNQDNLIEELQTKLEEVEAENVSLKNQIPNGEEVGNPIYLSDSSDLECEIVPIGGAEQATREGYNLLISPATQTKNGITFTVNDDNSITVNGTAEADTSINFVNSSGSTLLSFEAGTYKLTGCPEGGSDTTYRLGMNLNFGMVFDTGNGAVMTLNASTTNKAVWLTIYAGTTVNNLKFYPMLIKGTDDKPYEQYGAMPSPEFKSQVKTVGQNVNIFDKDNANTLNAIINGTTKQIASFNTCRSIYISCKNNEDYTISRKAGTGFIVGTTTDEPVLNATCNQIVQNNTANSITIKTTENDNYLVVFYYNGGTDTLTEEEIRNSIKIEKGLVATPYSPPGQGCVEIEVCNKNILSYCDGNWNVAGVDVTVDKKGLITLNGTCTAATNIFFTLKKTLKLNGIYSFQTGNDKVLTTGEYFRLYTGTTGFDVLKAFATVTSINQKSENVQISGTADRLALRINQGTVFKNVTLKPQLEVSQTATNYIEHESYTKVLPIQQEMCKMGDVEDTFIKVDGKWYEKHYSTKVILDGSQKITYYSAPNEELSNLYSTAYFSITGLKKASANEFYCNQFGKTYLTLEDIWGSAKDTDKAEGIAIGTDSSIRLRINKDRLTGYSNDLTSTEKATLCKNYLSENNIITYYPLATPELIECTAEQSAILNSFYTYKGITNISVDGIGTLKVNYKKDLETIINNLLVTSVAE